MGPVEQREAYLDVAQPSLLAGPRSTGDEPEVVRPASGEGGIDQTVRHHVLPQGRQRSDPGTRLTRSDSDRSKTITSWPARCRSAAVAHPAIDPPIMPTLMPVAPDPLERHQGGDTSGLSH